MYVKLPLKNLNLNSCHLHPTGTYTYKVTTASKVRDKYWLSYKLQDIATFKTALDTLEEQMQLILSYWILFHIQDLEAP